MAEHRVARCLERGMALAVATVDANGAPSGCRAIALASPDDLATVTVYLPIATSQQVMHDVATTHRMAIVVNHVIEHRSVQLKGTTLAARVARDDERAFVEGRLDDFADTLDRVGVPRRITKSLAHWPAFAVDMRVEQIFDQSPGPNAGNRLP